MIQDIITSVFIAYCAGYTLYNLYSMLVNLKKKNTLPCNGCSNCHSNPRRFTISKLPGIN